MKNYILKKGGIFHFLSLGLIAASLFLKAPFEKMIALLVGILGLLILSLIKKQKILVIIYLILFLAAGTFYYLKTNGQLNF